MFFLRKPEPLITTSSDEDECFIEWLQKLQINPKVQGLEDASQNLSASWAGNLCSDTKKISKLIPPYSTGRLYIMLHLHKPTALPGENKSKGVIYDCNEMRICTHSANICLSDRVERLPQALAFQETGDKDSHQSAMPYLLYKIYC